jgi:hypothetical protein
MDRPRSSSASISLGCRFWSEEHTLFVQGARSVLFRPKSWANYSFARWLTDAARRLHKNVLAIALANKLARIVWAVLHRGTRYEPAIATKA